METIRQEQAATQIAHVLFLDIVGYSQGTTTAQSKFLGDLTDAVNGTPTYASAKANNSVLALPTGDGMALLYSGDVVSAARSAVETAKALKQKPELKVRMGIHSGLIQRQKDITGRENVVGEGINTAQRIMDFADPGHILLSAQYANWLRQFDDWAPYVAEIGEGTAKHGLKLGVFNLCSEEFGRSDAPSRIAPITSVAAASGPSMKLVILYKRKAEPDDQVLAMLEERLTALGHELFIDRHLKIGVEWAKAIEEKIRSADAILAILSDAAVGSEMLEYELETAFDENRKRGKPYLLPIRVGSDKAIEGPVGSFVNSLNFSTWHGPQDNSRVVAEIVSSITEPIEPKNEELQLEPVGGAVPPDSPFYVERSVDAEFTQAVRSNESIILVKGPRQMGKTSLIGRGAMLVRDLGWRTTMTDFQKLSTAQLASEDLFYKLLAATMSKRLKFNYDFESEWLDVFGANMNMDNFIRAALEAVDEPFVWFMDEADKLFGVPFASDFFGLVRSWHNSRATEPDGPWSRFTVVIGYATEAHLFIQDLNQSPFNVGRQLELRGFTLAETKDLNERYGSPIKSAEDAERLHALIGGQPFLTRRALDVLSRGVMDFEALLAQADREDGPFGDHLKRILISVSQMPSVLEALRTSLSNPLLKDSDGFHRLLSAGVVEQTSDNKVRMRCELYSRYLSGHVGA